eukprot:Gb_22517 [translate_table: standard]
MMMDDWKSMTRLLLATIAIASLLAGFLIKRFARAKGKYPPGQDMESIYVEELGGTSKWQLYDILVEDLMKAAIEIDWREFFPYLSWEFQWDLPLGDEDLADTVSLTTHKLHLSKAIVTPEEDTLQPTINIKYSPPRSSNRQGVEAINIFQQMRLASVKPDSKTFATILVACANLADLEQGMEIHRETIRCGSEFEVFVGTALVDMYAKCGNMEKACHPYKFKYKFHN